MVQVFAKHVTVHLTESVGVASKTGKKNVHVVFVFQKDATDMYIKT